METHLSPLLPAFHLLWNSAKNESRKHHVNDRVNANYGQSPRNKVMNEFADKPTKTGVDKLCSEAKPESSSEQCINENGTNYGESVVVCTLECDHGDKFVRQIIHDGTTKSEWSRAEDVFVDWLNSDLTSQHAKRIDGTIYFCRIPVSTSSDGICLWLKNLRDEGKEVNIIIKIASIGQPILQHTLEALSNNISQTRGPLHELNEMEDTVKAIRRLAKLGAQVEPVSSGDWLHLISLLTDRASLHVLDLKRSPSADILTTMLQTTL
uniref:Ig-like domain-containing protein n=1 Tax=Arion vulgaris TaxID=1028688 RepID=A0A0B7AYX4_9EUPU